MVRITQKTFFLLIHFYGINCAMKLLISPVKHKTLFNLFLFEGFGSKQFHFKVGNASNTVTIIETNSNSVFGGFTRASWNNPAGYAGDFNAFLYSLRRNGTADPRILKNGGTQDRSTAYNIYSSTANGPSFGKSAYDLNICSYSHEKGCSTSLLGYTYQLPVECTYNSACANSFLAGSYTGWLTTEIEVYQMVDPITTTVRPGMDLKSIHKNFK